MTVSLHIPNQRKFPRCVKNAPGKIIWELISELYRLDLKRQLTMNGQQRSVYTVKLQIICFARLYFLLLHV